MNYYFVALLILCTVYALAAGGAPERIGAAVYALSCAATHVVLEASQILWRSIEYGVFVIDLAMFAFFCVLAIRADRYWPIWVSALLGLGVLGHLARWAGPDVIPWAYAVILTIWSYPILASIAIGTFNHHRKTARSETHKPWAAST